MKQAKRKNERICKKEDFTLADFADSSKRRKVPKVSQSYDHVDGKTPAHHCKSNSQNPEPGGHEYQLDVWIHISRYIKPEDVGRFAAICRASHEVTHTAGFWINLYKRYIQARYDELPRSLKRNYENLNCRRSLVIRALFCVYPPFVKTRPLHPVKTLNSLQCIQHWSEEKSVGKWRYFFKFNKYLSNRQPCQVSFEEKYGTGVNVNSEEDKIILELVCPYFTLVRHEEIMGMQLYRAGIEAARAKKKRKLQLIFASEVDCAHSFTALNSGNYINFEGLLYCRVLQWWDPFYPHQHLEIQKTYD